MSGQRVYVSPSRTNPDSKAVSRSTTTCFIQIAAAGAKTFAVRGWEIATQDVPDKDDAVHSGHRRIVLWELGVARSRTKTRPCGGATMLA